MATVETMATELSGTVGDAMTRAMVAVHPKISAAETADQLAASGVRHAIVVSPERQVLGVVSQREIFAHFMDSLNVQGASGLGDDEYAPWEIGSLVRQPPITVSTEVPLAKAGLVLSSYKVDCLPVVDGEKRLIGSLSITELLRHITQRLEVELDEEFQFYKPERETRPPMPAYFRRANGALVLPVACLADTGGVPGFAVLGYESATGRIVLKFVADKEDGARKVVRDHESLVIAASDFVAHFDIKFHGTAFDVSRHRKQGCLILTPRQPSSLRAH